MLSLPRRRSCHAPLTTTDAPHTMSEARDRIEGHRTAGALGSTAPASRPQRLEESAMATQPPAGDPVQDAPDVTAAPHAAAGLPAVAHTLRISLAADGPRAHRPDPPHGQPEGRLRLPLAAPGRRATSGTSPSSARTARRPSPRRPRCAASPPPSSPRTPSPTSPPAAATGSASRAASPIPCTWPRAPTGTSRSPGTRRSGSSPTS